MGRFLLFPVGLLAASAAAYPSVTKRYNDTEVPEVNDFKDITPSADLTWVPCFGGFKCTYLTVPLDYADPSVGTTNIAFVKYQAVNSTGQSILYNPGGPGASGVASLVSTINEFHEIFGTDYDFVGFDPRGVNNSGPAPLSCSRAKEINFAGPRAEIWAQAVANGQVCTEYNKGTEAKYAGTAAVVQDMMHFTELEAAARGEDPKESKIWYYGVSYGTVLGQTLAAMYPDRLGRVIVDANIYGVAHYTGFEPSSFEDVDDAFAFFFEYCFQAGADLCPLAGNATSAVSIEQRYLNLLKKLEHEPLLGKAPALGEIVTRLLMSNLAFHSMYAPNSQFYALAQAIAAFEKGDPSVLPALMALHGMPLPTAEKTCEKPGNELQLITCTDVASRYALKSAQDYIEAINELETKTIYGTIGEQNLILCAGLDIVPPESQFFAGFEVTQTSVPILFVGTTGDPVTPISGAHKMAEYFPGSAVLTQLAPGHSFQAIKSPCTIGHVNAYLKSAALPPPGTECDVGSVGRTVFESGKETFDKLVSAVAAAATASK